MGLFSGKLKSDAMTKKLADARGHMDRITGRVEPEADVSEEARQAMEQLTRNEEIGRAAEAEQQARKNLYERGLYAPAVLHGIEDPDIAAQSGDARMYYLDVTIELQTGESFRTVLSQWASPSQIEGIQASNELTAWYDPVVPEHAQIMGW